MYRRTQRDHARSIWVFDVAEVGEAEGVDEEATCEVSTVGRRNDEVAYSGSLISDML